MKPSTTSSAADVSCKPRYWILARATGAARNYVDTLYEKGSDTWLQYDDVAKELSREVVTSKANAQGHTRSLHVLKTDDKQAFHIHLPHTAAGSVMDAAVLKEPASHRLVFAMTGKEPGMFEWADAKGPIAVEAENEINTATGKSADTGYKTIIPPYSMVAIELMGGIHHFHNIRGLSYHRLNMPSQEGGDNITLNTQQWRGDLPSEFHHLQPTLIYPNLDPIASAPETFTDPDCLKLFMERSYEWLANAARETRATKHEAFFGTARAFIPQIYIEAQNAVDAQSTRPPDRHALTAETFGRTASYAASVQDAGTQASCWSK